MELGTEHIVLKGLNDGEFVEFKGITTLDELKTHIVNSYFPLCSSCNARGHCEYELRREPCQMLVKVLDNFVDMNIRSIDTSNGFDLSRFIEITISLVDIIYNAENLKWMYLDDYYNVYLESVHPKLTLGYVSDLLVDLSKLNQSYRVVKTDRVKKFVVIVEGDSEEICLPSVFDSLDVIGVIYARRNSVRFVNIKGKDSLQKSKIADILTKYREDDISYFIIMDNDDSVDGYINDLKRADLVSDENYLIWENKFEDNFSEEIIIGLLQQIEPAIFNEVSIAEVVKINSDKNDIAKSVEKALANKGINLNFDDYKKPIAKILSTSISKELRLSRNNARGFFDANITPTSVTYKDFVEKIRKVTIYINRISKEFHVVSI